ncbi:uncharacterized protein LOC132926168 [Rhopalosiphum padi]|uniref:uncharacterized protein LOC132926168 n=1 Tax=Rhopalosiphum padi TaxID=40932 RepID=UPI00298E5779|nr:uncharacterized protein LOC132926168 [Rhopalosiphum padi]
MSIVEKHLSSRGHQCLIYADDLVIFTSNKLLNLAIENLNLALKDLSEILIKVSFEIAPEKSKSVIFTRRRYVNHPDILIDDIIIPIVPNVTYLGITLDSKLRWFPHINSLTSFVSRWSNFLRTVTGTWWGPHPSSLLSIYLSIIRSKLDYGCFLYDSASYSIWKKINKHQTSCLRNIMGYVRSTPRPAIEVETLCPPFNVRCRWLAGKFLLKSLSHTDHYIFDTFYSLYLNWRYVPKTMPVLSDIANVLSVFHHYVMRSDKPPIYNQSYDSLLYFPPVHLCNLFSDLSSNDFKKMSHCMVNAAFSNHLFVNFPNFIVVYTDGSVSPFSAGYAFYIPELRVSFSNNLPSSSSSFTAECYAIFDALTLIFNLAPNKYLIASDSMSCLQALNSNPLRSKLSPLVQRIKLLIFNLNSLNYTIHFIWIPGHTGIHGNEFVDNLAKSTSNIILPSVTLLPHSDFTPFIKRYTTNLWSSYWNNLPGNFASRYRDITPNILNNIWFSKFGGLTEGSVH